MAIKDVKHYYYTMQAQYLEMKADLADFEEAVKNGFITEEQLDAAREEVAKVENNYDRLSYIMYLLEIPNRQKKRAKHAEVNRNLLNFFECNSGSMTEVEAENKSALDALRLELKKLTKVDD